MSQHADIVIEVTSKAVKYNLSHEDAADLLQSVLCAAGYEDELAEYSKEDMPSLVSGYLRTQKDGLYGVSHSQMDEWIKKTV